MTSAHLMCLQQVCITCNIHVYIDSLGAFPNTLLGGMSSHTCSPCTDSIFHTLAGMNTFSTFDFSVDIPHHFVYRKYVPLLILFICSERALLP